MRMRQLSGWSWVEAEVAQTIATWQECATPCELRGPRYSQRQQRECEQAYDNALQAVERDAKRAPRTKAARIAMQRRTVESFARFAAAALNLPQPAIQLLTKDFLPVGTKLAQWARRFDASLSMAEIIQACRNAWTACGLQPLLGESVKLTPSILGYSLLYPYSDNYLDREDLDAEQKTEFSQRFRARLRGEDLACRDDREAILRALIALIEEQYSRIEYPGVFESLLAIHRAQEESIEQTRTRDCCLGEPLLRLSCAKGGTSVWADACLARGWMQPDESRFAFEWGVLLQLGDDLQDLQEDARRGSATLFSCAAAAGKPLDDLVMQLLNFSERVGQQMDALPHGTHVLKDLLKMSWRSLIIGAVADSYEYFSPEFLQEAERCSPFHFAFLRARRKRLEDSQGLYAVLFNAFLEAPDEETDDLPAPELVRNFLPETALEARFGSSL